jgi:Amt family ammonium transporter
MLGFDDSLDVVGIHMVGGLIGTAMIGLVGSSAIDGENDGLFYGGGIGLLGLQLVGAIAVMIYSFVLAFIIGITIEKTIGFRVDEETERTGIDEAEHAEVGYERGVTRGGRSGHLVSGTSGKKLEESKS